MARILARIQWEKLDKMCCRCEEDATHKFVKETLFRYEEKFYCDEHILERTKEEGVQW